MFNLSIVLITYNRSEFLNKTLCQIAYSPFSNCEIWILNNASTDSTLDVCAKWSSHFFNMQVVTHGFNIGGNANILRAYEYGTQPYKWILCDDDELRFEHTEDLVNALEAAQYDIIRVSSVGVSLGEEGAGCSLGDLLHNQKGVAFWSFGFVPGVIFRSSSVESNVKYGYSYVHTAYQQLFVLLRSFKLDSKVYTTVKPIVVRGSAPTGIGSEIFVYWLKSLDALPDQESRKIALKLIFGNRYLNLGRLFLGDIRLGRSHREIWSIWKQVFVLAPSLKTKMIVWLSIPFVFFPIKILMILYPIVTGKPFVGVNFEQLKRSRE